MHAPLVGDSAHPFGERIQGAAQVGIAVHGSPVVLARGLEITQELVDAGLNTPLLEVVGASEADNLETIRLFGEKVLPNLKPGA